ncbi:hypothetical protein TNCV_3932091 [Trichonephila clavipes]|nr:hypothetical protein TNCV_3932091 [Trichonephila clavipes]
MIHLAGNTVHRPACSFNPDACALLSQTRLTMRNVFLARLPGMIWLPKSSYNRWDRSKKSLRHPLPSASITILPSLTIQESPQPVATQIVKLQKQRIASSTALLTTTIIRATFLPFNQGASSSHRR